MFKRKLEKKYSSNNNNVKILSDEPYLEDMAKLYFGEESNINFSYPKIGEVLTGKLIAQSKEYIILDINAKDNVFIELRDTELRALSILAEEEDLVIGETLIKFLVTQSDYDNSSIVGSLAQLKLKENQDVLINAVGSKNYFECFVKESISCWL